jgi:hypothetical protein
MAPVNDWAVSLVMTLMEDAMRLRLCRKPRVSSARRVRVWGSRGGRGLGRESSLVQELPILDL